MLLASSERRSSPRSIGPSAVPRSARSFTSRPSPKPFRRSKSSGPLRRQRNSLWIETERLPPSRPVSPAGTWRSGNTERRNPPSRPSSCIVPSNPGSGSNGVSDRSRVSSVFPGAALAVTSSSTGGASSRKSAPSNAMASFSRTLDVATKGASVVPSVESWSRSRPRSSAPTLTLFRRRRGPGLRPGSSVETSAPSRGKRSTPATLSPPPVSRTSSMARSSTVTSLTSTTPPATSSRGTLRRRSDAPSRGRSASRSRRSRSSTSTASASPPSVSWRQLPFTWARASPRVRPSDTPGGMNHCTASRARPSMVSARSTESASGSG